jgi:hypothetical protein
MAFFLALGCSSLFPGILGVEVDDARDGSWRRCFTVWLYLAAKPSHAGVDVDGLACPLHRPVACSHQMRGQAIRCAWAPMTTSHRDKFLRPPLPEATGSAMLIHC